MADNLNEASQSLEERNAAIEKELLSDQDDRKNNPGSYEKKEKKGYLNARFFILIILLSLFLMKIFSTIF